MKIGKLVRNSALVAICIIVGLVLVGIAIPNRIGNGHSHSNMCINNLRLIDACKQEWALEHSRTNGPVSWDDIAPYIIRLGEKPESIRCPSGGKYTLGNVEEMPKCTIPKHSLNPAEQ